MTALGLAFLAAVLLAAGAHGVISLVLDRHTDGGDR